MNNRLLEQKIYEEWSPILKEKYNIQDPTKLKWMSKLAHNQTLNENNGYLNENFNYASSAYLSNVPDMGAVRAPSDPGGIGSFYSGAPGSGDKFPVLLPIAMQVAVRTVGFDIVNVIPMNGPAAMLAYMDFQYAGGRLDTEDQPIMIKIDANNINNTPYTVGGVYWGVSTPASGSNYVDNTKAIKMIFVGYSFYDSFPIFRLEQTYNILSNALNVDETLLVGNIFDGTAGIVKDNGSNYPSILVAENVNVSAEPKVVLALEDHIQGVGGAGSNDENNWSGPYVDGSNPADPMTRATGESTYYRVMGLKVHSKLIEAETFQYAAVVTTEQIQDLNRQWGLDVLGMVENNLINEISQSINKHILSRAFALGWSHNAELYKSQNFTVNFTTDITKNTPGTSPQYINKFGTRVSLPVPKFQDFGGGYENMSTIQRRIKGKVLFASNLIQQRSRRGAANFIVTNVQIATALQDTAQYTVAPMTNTINQNGGDLYPLGTVAGMTIYVDPNMGPNDNRILVGRKGNDDEPGLKFCPYLMAEKIETIAENTMSPKMAIKSRYALVEAGHHPQTMYYTIFCDVGSVGIA